MHQFFGGGFIIWDNTTGGDIQMGSKYRAKTLLRKEMEKGITRYYVIKCNDGTLPISEYISVDEFNQYIEDYPHKFV